VKSRWCLALSCFLLMLWCLAMGCSPSVQPSYGIATGKVTEEGTSAALEGAYVVLAGYETSTDSEGAFLIDSVPVPESGEWSLSATLDGFRTYDKPFVFSAPGDLAVVLSPVDNRDTAGTLDGIVRAAGSGEPLGPAEVTVSTLVGATVIDKQTSHTSYQGNWQMSGIAIGQCRVEVTLEGWLPDMRLVTVYPGQGSNPLLEIELVEGTSRVTVTGRVFDVETQEVLAGAVVGDDESARTVTTDATGAFSLPEVLVGTRTFRATATGYDPTFVTTMVLAEPDPLTIGMARASGGPPGVPGTVAGHVTLVGGASPAGAIVRLRPQTGTQVLETRTLDETGAFGFLVAPGTYRLEVTKAGYQTARITARYDFGVPVRDLTVRLTPTP
jgi:hypothetical protein